MAADAADAIVAGAAADGRLAAGAKASAAAGYQLAAAATLQFRDAAVARMPPVLPQKPPRHRESVRWRAAGAAETVTWRVSEPGRTRVRTGGDSDDVLGDVLDLAEALELARRDEAGGFFVVICAYIDI